MSQLPVRLSFAVGLLCVNPAFANSELDPAPSGPPNSEQASGVIKSRMPGDLIPISVKITKCTKLGNYEYRCQTSLTYGKQTISVRVEYRYSFSEWTIAGNSGW